MHPLTDAAIRSSFVNASRREVREAILPALSGIDWDATDLLGWRDRKKDATAYDVTMYVARRAGAPGRRGNTIGTLICGEFGCSANVRRRPTLTEVGSSDENDRIALIARRIGALREHSTEFVRQVASTR